MKRIILVLAVLLIASAHLCAQAEEGGRLYPAKDDETGLWGYIDGRAEWAIPPQFSWAGEFRGNYALVTPAGEDPWEMGHDGIIDRQGGWVLEPKYSFTSFYDFDPIGGLDEGLYFVFDGDDESWTGPMGFFDIPSGFFSGLIYDEVLGRYDALLSWALDRLIPVEKGGRIVYVDRHTGETAFTLPDQFKADDCWYDAFQNGYAMILTDENEYGDGMAGAIFVDERGEIRDLGGLIARDDDELFGLVTPGGILRVKDAETGLYGFYDLNKEDFLIPPQFAWADDFSVSGYACVMLEDGAYGHIDRTGRVLAQGFEEYYTFYGEYAQTDGKLINAAGETVLELPEGFVVYVQEDDLDRYGYNYLVSPEGLIELQLHDGYVIGSIVNLRGEWVLPSRNMQAIAASEDYAGYLRFFSEGIQPILRGLEIGEDGREWKYAYMNAQGTFITDFIYDQAGVFLGELAPFHRDGVDGYIDKTGREVFTWQENDD